MIWNLEKVAQQAVVLYEQERIRAKDDGDVQGEYFWLSHRNTAFHALRGDVDTPVTEKEIADLITTWNKS